MRRESLHRASLALNLALVVAVVALAAHKLGGKPAPTAGEGSRPGPTKTAEAKSETKKLPAEIEQRKWPRYAEMKSATERRRSVVDQLRAMGAPNDVLALVAQIDFETQWDGRFEACGGDSEKMAAVRLEMNKTKDAEMRAALGDEGFRQWDQKSMLWEAMSTEVEVASSEANAI
jgi:hypothetical protein